MKRFLLLALTAGLLMPLHSLAHYTPEVMKDVLRLHTEFDLEAYLSAICEFKKQNNWIGIEEKQTQIAKELSKKRLRLALMGNDMDYKAIPPKTINGIIDLASSGEECAFLRELYY